MNKPMEFDCVLEFFNAEFCFAAQRDAVFLFLITL